MLSAFLIVAEVFWLPIILLWWIRSIPNTKTATGGVLVLCSLSALMVFASALLAIGFSAGNHGG